MTAADAHNRRRWDGQERNHYEVWYLTGNHPTRPVGWWIRYTLEAPLDRPPYCQLWFAHFDADDPSRTFGINRVLPIDQHDARAEPFAVRVGEATLRSDGARGALAGAGHEASWELSWAAGLEPLRQLPRPFYWRDGLGDTTVLSPSADAVVTGHVTVDGERIELRAAPFGQTHLWGRRHAVSWAWAHCNGFADHPGAVLECLTARIRKAGRVTPPLTAITLWLDGRAHRFNRLLHTLRNRAQLATGLYRFAAQSRTHRLEGELHCRPEDMVLARYEDPDGALRHCANTEVADLRLTLFERRGGRFVERAHLLAPRRGHFEIGAPDPDPAIARAHVTI